MKSPVPCHDAVETANSCPSPGWRDYVSLTKPTISLLVVITAIPGFVLSTNERIDLFKLFMTLIGTMLASSSAATFNQLIETDIDHTMKRTKNRSFASGRVAKLNGCIFGVVLGILGIGMLYSLTTPLAAFISLAGHVFYVLIYTVYLKPRTPQNIVIGGAAGAVGPLIGWAAATGQLSLSAWIMFLIIFLWTPPHFWALALKYKDDYAAAGIPMYPVVYGDAATRKAIFWYSLSLLPTVASLYMIGTCSLLYLIISLALTLKFVWDAFKIYQQGNNTGVMQLFIFSCFYTFAIFGAMLV